MRFSIAAFLASLAGVAASQPVFPHPERIRYDGQCFTIEGKDTLLFSGAFHYFRCPRELWGARLKSIKAAGFNAVETYVPWNYSEPNPPSTADDFSKIDLAELDEFLSEAEDIGLYTIVRPGPYICAEWATGGFPQWLVAKKPLATKRSPWLRSDDPEFLRWSKHWLDAVCKIVRKHQLSSQPAGHKGTILFQLENEYDYFREPEDAKVAHLRFLAKTVIDDGIEIPLFTCWTHQIRKSTDSYLKQVFDTCNEYPRWDIDSVRTDLDKLAADQPWAPKMVTELQGGWFGGVGGQLAEEQDGIDASQINAVTFMGLATGMTSSNYYMLFGGTNFGDWAAEGITTSYDYFAPIREWGGRGEKYEAVLQIGALVSKYGEELARATEDSTYKIASPDMSLKLWIRKAQNGARFVFIHNPSRTLDASGALQFADSVVHYKLNRFGFKVYRLAPDGKDGEWFPELNALSIGRLKIPPVSVEQGEISYPLPTAWRPTRPSVSVAELGVEGSEFVFYRFSRPSLSLAGHLFIRPFGGTFYSTAVPEGVNQGFTGFLWPLARDRFELVLENPGYPNFGPEIEAKRGIAEARLFAAKPPDGPLPPSTQFGLEFATQLSDPPGKPYDLNPDPEIPRIEHPTGLSTGRVLSHLVVRSRVNFSLPNSDQFAWEAVLHAGGDGFLKINGHPLGRYWRQGPQRAFYMPECWLKEDNILELTAIPNDGDGRIDRCRIEPQSK